MVLHRDPTLDARALVRLRTEHVRILRRANRLQRALRGGGRLNSLEMRSLRAFSRLLANSFLDHLASEERDTFARLERSFPELGGTLDRLREEHDELRAMIADLATLLDREPGEERDERLFVLGSDLTELLRLHIHAEEHAAYDWIARLPAPAPPRRRRGARTRPAPSSETP